MECCGFRPGYYTGGVGDFQGKLERPALLGINREFIGISGVGHAFRLSCMPILQPDLPVILSGTTAVYVPA